MSVPSQSNTSSSKRTACLSGVEHRNERPQFFGQRRLECKAGPRSWMCYDHSGRVQEHALEPLPGKRLVERKIAILVIAEDRKAQVGKVNPNLMRPPGLQVGFEQAVVAPRALQPEYRVRRRSFPADADPAFAGPQDELAEWQLDAAFGVAPMPFYEDGIGLLDLSLAQLPVKREQRRAPFSEHQHARCVAVESVRELDERRLRTGRAQLLHDAMADPAAAVDRNAGWLVHYDEQLILVDDGSTQRRRGPRRRCTRMRGDTHRRQAQAVAFFQSVFRTDAAAIDAHFAAAQDAIDVALWHPFQVLGQVVVDALAGGVHLDLVPARRIFT